LNKITKWFSVSLLLIASISCDDGPTSLGTNLLPEQDLINAHKINSVDLSFLQKSKFYDTDSLSLASAARIFLGKNGNVESTMLMKFYMFFPDSITDAIKGDSLVLNSAVIEMEPLYTYGDENNSFNFTVHEITNDWNSLEFGKNELELLTYNPEDISSNHQSSGDTSITFTFDIDKEIITNWLKQSAEETQADENFGIYFNYDNSTDKILGFPAISPEYDSVLTRLVMIVEVPGNFIDTLTVQVTSDVHVVNKIFELDIPSNQSIYAQGGIPIRSNLFIDVSTIPEYAIINRATLKLFVDEDNSEIGSIESKYVGLLMLEDYESSEINTSFAGVLLELDSVLTYSGDVTNFVQEWISNENNGIKLHLLDEIETINKISFYGTENPNISLRPYIEIIYTSKN